MKHNIILKRTVSTCAWRMIGRVAKASKRAELDALLLRVRDRGGSDANDIAEHLFFESRSRRVVAERLLRICEAYRLIEENRGSYVLTEEGLAAVETKEVFVPEDGTWTVWASDDPLLESPILSVKPWSEPNAYAEVRGEDRDKAKEREFEHLPSWLRSCVGRALRPCAGGGQSLRIDDLQDKGEAIAPDARVEVIWDIESGRLRAEGHIAGDQFNADLEAPTVSTEDVWRQLIEGEGFWHRWDTSREALLVDFDDTNDAERESMTRTMRFSSPETDKYGAFDTVSVAGVALAANSIVEADHWARWRLEARIRDYASQTNFDSWTREAAEPFQEHDLTLPDRAELAEQAWQSRSNRPSPRVWHLVAAEDWRL